VAQAKVIHCHYVKSKTVMQLKKHLDDQGFIQLTVDQLPTKINQNDTWISRN